MGEAGAGPATWDPCDPWPCPAPCSPETLGGQHTSPTVEACKPTKTMLQFSEILIPKYVPGRRAGMSQTDAKVRGGGTGHPPGWAARCPESYRGKGESPTVEPSSVLKVPPSLAELRGNSHSPPVCDTPALRDSHSLRLQVLRKTV